MQSRRDQVQAYFFTVGRLVSALMRGRPDDRTTPHRRFAGGSVAGLLLAAVVTAGFGILGAVSPGYNTSWKSEGAVTVEQETGARYVTLGGVLHPASNYASALLASDQEKYQPPTSVAQKSLQGAPRGAPIGIPGAPDSLPDPADPAALSRDPWTVCATTAPGTATPGIGLQVGAASGRPLPDREGALVSTPDKTEFLVWRGKKLRVPHQTAVRMTGSPDSTPYPVGDRWINTIPSGGADLTTPDITGIGTTTTRTAHGTPDTVGKVYVVIDRFNKPHHQYFVLRQDGLMPLTETTANLLLNDPKTAAAYPGALPSPLPGSPELLTAPRSSATLPPEQRDLPVQIDRHEPGSGDGPCAALDVAGNGGASIRIAPEATSPGGNTARVRVPPGNGVLLREQAVPGGPPGNTYLVDQLGVKYALRPGAQDKLGYAGVPTVTVPSSLLDVLPAGPALDPATATHPHRAPDPSE